MVFKSFSSIFVYNTYHYTIDDSEYFNPNGPSYKSIYTYYNYRGRVYNARRHIFCNFLKELYK